MNFLLRPVFENRQIHSSYKIKNARVLKSKRKHTKFPGEVLINRQFVT